jgi:hypothetical protein
MTASTWIEVGLGANGEVRDFLGRLQLRDPSLRWYEGRGFITRRYDVTGSQASIATINGAVADFLDRVAAQQKVIAAKRP